MRFYRKSGPVDWFYLTLTLALIVLIALKRPDHGLHSLIFYLWVVMFLMQLANMFLIYWDITAEGLRERRHWHLSSFEWRELTRVSLFDPKRRFSSLALEYTSDPPLHHGSLIANPGRREQFLAELRAHAPQATFDL